MKHISPPLHFFIRLAQLYTKTAQVFDRRLLGGLGFNDLIILYYLSQAPDERMRRIDIADKVGLTPSGITRMLLPMEKVGLVQREAAEQDARVSYVKLAPGGKRLLQETLEQAEMVAEEMLPSMKLTNTKDLSEIFKLFVVGLVG
jgi:DNA-binding MarR family transcriptional regulator